MTTDTTTAALADLPPLPDGVTFIAGRNRHFEKVCGTTTAFTADQMREYAQAALLRANAAVVPEGGPDLWWLCEADNIKSGATWIREPRASDIDWVNNVTRKKHIAMRLAPIAAAPSAPVLAEPQPIDMVLHCPTCGMQHVDAPEDLPMPMPGSMFEGSAGWTNPPHRSHLCHGCGHIWRPADVPTNGVKTSKTKGKADHPPVSALAQQPVQGGGHAVTDAMVDAYLKANDAYWRRTDQLPTPPDKWRTGTPREATRESLRAALAIPPAQPAPQAQEPVAQQAQGDGDLVLVERSLLGAACSAIDKKRDAPNVLAKLRALHLAARASLPTSGVPVAQDEGGVPLAWRSCRDGLLAYVLQGDLHNRLTPRVVDVAYSAFMSGLSGKNPDDGGPCDWFNDTKPMVVEAIAKMHKDLFDAMPAPQPAAARVGLSDTDLLDAMQRQRIAVIPEFEGPWDAHLYGEDGEPASTCSGDTPRAALDALLTHGIASPQEDGGEKA